MVEGDKDMGKTQIVVESIWGREKENVRVEKKERKKVMVEGEGEREGGVEEGEQESYLVQIRVWFDNVDFSKLGRQKHYEDTKLAS